MTTFAVTTFGCQMNKHDSERLEEVLRRAGHLPVAAEVASRDADVIVVNTCSVREKAEQKLRSEVGRLARLKRTRPELVLVVAGCMAQHEGERILKQMPAVDLVLGPDNIAELPELLAQLRLGGLPIVRTRFDLDAPRFLTAPSVTAGHPTAFVTTMKGCNERCSFCIVPTTRGPERYRPSEAILDEVAELVRGGVREVTLLGQTVNSYRDPSGLLEPAIGVSADDADESEFAALLRVLAEQVPQLCRIRYESPHPRHLTASLIAAHRDLAILPRHVHMPVQSGSDRVLKRMIRRHTRAEFLARLQRLRAAVVGLTVSTDVIVGFPGETEADFLQTLSLLEEMGACGVFGFMYSPRPHTPALRLQDDVAPEVKAERLQRVFGVSERLLGEHLRGLVGSRQEVLVEGPSKARPENLTGRSGRGEIIHIADALDVDVVGELVEVEVVEAYKHSLLARLTPAARARAAPLPASAAPPRRSLPLMGEGKA